LVESQTRTLAANPRILLYCSESKDAKDLVSQLSQKYVVIQTSRYRELEILGAKDVYAMMLIEIPRHEKAILKTLKFIFKRQPQSLVVLLNGLPEQSTLAAAFQLGICDYFPAPVNISLLIERIDVLLNEKRSEKI